MAIGAARVLGIKLMANFDRPYQSRSIQEFWRKWHISLSSWFKDYLYIPLGGNRVTIPRWYFNLFLVFLICGLWHGANWTLVIWGGLHGFYSIFALITKKWRDRVNRFFLLDRVPLLSVLTTFGLVSFAWIFFRADNVHTAFYIIEHIFTGIPDLLHGRLALEPLGLPVNAMILSVFLIVLLETVQYVQGKINLTEFFLQKSVFFRWAMYYALILTIVFLGVFENRQFIYFQF